MSVQITYFVHGTTLDNENHRSSGWNDAALSPLGVEQGKTLGEQTADKHFDVVFCSDLSRAHITAKTAFGTRGIPIIPDARLRECNYGDFNGGDSAIVEPMQERMIDVRFPNGESYEDVKTRLESLLETLRTEYDGKSVALVAHKAPQLALNVILKGMSWEEAFATDWRKTKAWQPGWAYEV